MHSMKNASRVTTASVTPGVAGNIIAATTAKPIMGAAADAVSAFSATANYARYPDILTRNASHGYELIKEIETLTCGNYTPSPGVIYPTLDLLQDQQFIIIHEEDGGRKKIAITSQGQAWLAENSEHLQHIQARIKARSVGYQLRKDPQMKRALENFKAVLDLKVNQSEISAAQLKQIIGIIDRAALDISQLD